MCIYLKKQCLDCMETLIVRPYKKAVESYISLQPGNGYLLVTLTSAKL